MTRPTNPLQATAPGGAVCAEAALAEVGDAAGSRASDGSETAREACVPAAADRSTSSATLQTAEDELGRALYFGAAGRALFGFVHAPSGRSREAAVVVCPPLGAELQCTYRSHRRLAQQLSGHGFWTLRFDYYGTGDSGGESAHPDAIAGWLESIRVAVMEAKRLAGVERVVLMGTRLGATLAATLVSEGLAASALVLLAPCPSGHGFLRELRAMHSLYRAGLPTSEGRDQREGDEQILGTLFRASALAALREIDLTKRALPPSLPVLMVPRDDLPQRELSLAEKWRAAGASIHVETPPGYAAMVHMMDPVHATVPEEVLATIVRWLAERFELTDDARSGASVAESTSALFDGVRESALRLAGERRLFAILVEPPEPDKARPVVVIPNTGANHRIGNHRHWVSLARMLARAGFSTLRLDVSGLGDSPPRPGRVAGALYALPALEDVSLSLDSLEARGYRRFVLSGLCSGAYLAYHAAVRDARVEGLISMNPLVFELVDGLDIGEPLVAAGQGDRSSTHELKASLRAYKRPEEYARALLQAETWQRLLKGDVNVRGIASAMVSRARGTIKRQTRALLMQAGLGGDLLTPRAKELRELMARNVRVLMLWDQTETTRQELAADLGAYGPILLRERGFSERLYPHADHTFTPLGLQDEVNAEVLAFLQRA